MILVFFLFSCKNIYCFIEHKRKRSTLTFNLSVYESLVSAKCYGGQVSLIIVQKEHKSERDVKGGNRANFTDENLAKIPEESVHNHTL